MSLADLVRRAVMRLTTPLKSASYKCGKCGLQVDVTDYPDQVMNIIEMAIGHACKPRAKTL
ncbi:hypothetical protein [Streptomyces acidiscabies]|uniref:Transposase n=1 Tax=Streptomyces acidiscabies TaxID=42234 RepID=A0ABU4MBX8_9ACTN|nr:hypothetical protein [Streptomyces acidiscabies]MDX3025356.1 hypothetical protein [Streptomyces acidiscabies]